MVPASSTAPATVPSSGTPEVATVDPWIQAYCHSDGPEVFYGIASPQQIWQDDPFDVESIHAEARDKFYQLLNRVLQASVNPRGAPLRTTAHPGATAPTRTTASTGRYKEVARGAIMVLLGESGSGKTHLLRAFRHYVHQGELGYCAYMQMTTAADNYARYVLQYLIDSLQKPYRSSAHSAEETAFDRLTRRLLAQVPSLTHEEKQLFIDGSLSSLDDQVMDYADRLTACDRFHHCDADLIRVLLYAACDDHRIRQQALKWLRCQPITQARDLARIGHTPPRTQPEDPQRMLVQLAQLVSAVEQVPLVLLLDQIEDLALHNPEQAAQLFRGLIDTLTVLTDHSPHVFVVIACLEDYYTRYQQYITRSKIDRLTHDTPPIRLMSHRSIEEIAAVLEKRLDYFYQELQLPQRPHRLHPFQQQQLSTLSNLRLRDVLHEFYRHQQDCRRSGRWLEFPRPSASQPPATATENLQELWCQYLGSFKDDLPTEESDIATLLSRIIPACSEEMPDGVYFGCSQPQAPEKRYLEVDIHRSPNSVDKLLVAVCNRRSQGGGLYKQLKELVDRAGEIPTAIVRLQPFPRQGETNNLIAQLVRHHGRRVLLQEADLRNMLAFEQFHQLHGQTPEFRQWQRSYKPLTNSPAIQEILGVHALLSHDRDTHARTEPSAVVPTNPSPVATTTPTRQTSTTPPLPQPATIRLGWLPANSQAPLTIDPASLTQHVAVIGATGSGKTTAALNILEQLLSRGIPVLLIDRKGDLCRYADPQSWTEELNDPERRQFRDQLRQQLDIALYTPGVAKGRPLALSLFPTDDTPADDHEISACAQYVAASLAAMLSLRNSSSDRAQLAILTRAVEILGRRQPQQVTIPALCELIGSQDDELLCTVNHTFREQHYQRLAENLQTLWVQHEKLFKVGDPLDIGALLPRPGRSSAGRCRLTIINTQSLTSDQARDFWVAQLLIALGRWCSRHPCESLQAAILLDEADAYLPANRNPATKSPLEHLIRRARSAGLALFLATQNPGDFDYRCRENIGTWIVGRIHQERSKEKLRPLFEGANRQNVLNRLPGLERGHFYYLGPDGTCQQFRSAASVIQTKQIPNDTILQLAATQNTHRGT